MQREVVMVGLLPFKPQDRLHVVMFLPVLILQASESVKEKSKKQVLKL
jgi:hypothetical protein